jgi:hypothetical protein
VREISSNRREQGLVVKFAGSARLAGFHNPEFCGMAAFQLPGTEWPLRVVVPYPALQKPHSTLSNCRIQDNEWTISLHASSVTGPGGFPVVGRAFCPRIAWECFSPGNEPADLAELLAYAGRIA